MPTARTIAIVGATGAVGREFGTVLRQRRFPITAVRMLASARSAGQTVAGPLGPAVVEELTDDALRGIDLALF